MGGSGSGNWYRWNSKDTADSNISIDIRWCARHGYLVPGNWFSLAWTRNGQPTGNISVRVEGAGGRVTRLVLIYRSRRPGQDWQDVSEPVEVTYTPCHYGGQRPWFICPGVVNGRYCGRRVAILYGPSTYFLCRHCYDLAYQSQRENAAGRARDKAQNIRRRLGGSMNLGMPFPPKPPRMHWKTYKRLKWEADDAEWESWVALKVWLDRLDARLTKRRTDNA